MRILLVNDDGIDAPGIRAVADSLKDEHDVYVMAPSSQRSAAGHGATYFFQTVSAERREIPGVKDAWAINGTPADCVYLGALELMDEKPDLVISGVNQGRNLSIDCIYSGTVSAAMEGIVFGMPAIAISLCSYTSHDFSVATQYLKKIIPLYLQDPHHLDYAININVPECTYEQIKGVKVVPFEPGWKYEHDTTKEVVDEKHVNFHTNQDYPQDHIFGNGGDGSAVHDGYISVTPLGLDMVNHAYITSLKGLETESL